MELDRLAPAARGGRGSPCSRWRLTFGHVPSATRPLAWREIVVACVLAVSSAVALSTFGPPPEDAPVHLYRALLLHQGAVVWDNFWYGGHYPVSYGILDPVLAAVVGQEALLVVSAVVSAGIFAAISVRRFGDAARWPARLFGVLSAAPLFTGLASYALGLAFALGALLALQSGRAWLAGVLGASALASSPLAFAFLCIVLTGLLVSHRPSRPERRTAAWTLASLGAASVVGVGMLTVFPNGGVYPFNGWDLALVLALCASAGALAWQSAAGRPIAAVFTLWGLACLASFLVASPVGDNMTRLRGLVLPVTLIAAGLARFRPRWLAALAVALAVANNVGPYFTMIPDGLDQRPAHAAFWRPAIEYLALHRPPGYRVEVVPTAAHWEAYWLPRAGVPLARGWFRQLDRPALYDGRLQRGAYVTWLRETGTRFVLLPHTRLDPAGGSVEARVLRQAAPDLRPVFEAGGVTIYALGHPLAILRGAPGDRITEFGHTVIAGVVGRTGRHRLAVRYMPYWRVARGDVCLRRGPRGLTVLQAEHPGPFRLVVDQSPVSLIARIVGDEGGAACRGESGRAG